jgi:ribosomal protein L37E
MAKPKHECENCGKTFAEKYKLLLHYDFHRGEPVVREMGCGCGDMYDVRMGYCGNCGFVHSTGWRVINGEAVTK